MSRRRLATAVLTAAAVAATAAPAPAFDFGLGLFKRKKPNDQQPQQKSDASLKVKQLTATLQSDTDIDHRKSAAVDLRTQDPRANADIIPTLIGTLQKDPAPDVRALAAETLGGYKTVYTAAAAALETAEVNDPDKTVRAAAKSALWQYGLNGYRASAPAVPTQSGEPPLAKPVASPTTTRTASASPLKSPGDGPAFRPITQGPSNGSVYPQSAEPPLAKGKAESKASTVTPPPSVPQRMPTKLDVPEVTPPKPVITPPPMRGESKPTEANTVAPPVPTTSGSTPSVPLPLPSVPAVPMVMPAAPGQVPTVVPPGK